MINRIYIYVALAIFMSFPYLSHAQTFDWGSRVGASNSSYAQHLETDAEGNSYVAGSINGTATLGPSNINTNGSNAQFIAKLDSAGNFLWGEMNSGSIFTQDLTIDNAGNVYVSGMIYTLPVTIGTTTISSGPNFQYFLAKYDKNGVFKWVEHGQSNNSTTIGTDRWGNVNMAISFSGTASVNSTNYTSSIGGTASSILHVQFDSTGSVNWTDQSDFVSGSPNAYINVNGIDTDSVGDVYLVGDFSNGNIQLGTNTYNNPNDSSDYFIIKHNTTGTYQWSDVGSGPGYKSPAGVSVSGDQQVYVTGAFTNTATFGSTVLTPTGTNLDYFLIKYDTQGTMNWVIKGGGSGTRQISGITTDEDEPFLLGYFYNTLTLNGQTFSVTGNGAHIMVVKYDDNGQLLWVKDAGYNPANNAYNIAHEIGADNYGNLYMCMDAADSIYFDNIVVPEQGINDNGVIARLADTTYVPPVVPFPADSVWPGDANYDLIANNSDLLAIGIGYGTTGQTRANASNNWVAQPAYDWPQTLASGVNYKHLDCNGDGIINDQDTLAVSLNYGQIHAKNDGVEEVGPLLYTAFEDDSIMVGDTVDVTVNFGVDTMPANMIYGLAFTLDLDTALVDPSSLKFSYNSSWLGTKGTDMIGMYKNFSTEGKVDIAFTRIDQMANSGFGEIARFSIIIVDDITAKKYFSKTLKFNISNEYVIGVDEVTIPVSIGADSIIVIQEDTSGTNNTAIDPLLAKKVEIYPNPANDQVTIQVSDIMAQGYQLRDQMGRMISGRKARFTKEQISLAGLSSGVYILTIDTEKGRVVKKVFKN